MQDPATRLPRITLPRTSVNKDRSTAARSILSHFAARIYRYIHSALSHMAYVRPSKKPQINGHLADVNAPPTRQPVPRTGKTHPKHANKNLRAKGRDRNGPEARDVYEQREGRSLDMRTMLRGKISLLFIVCAVLLAIPAIALADDLRNNLDTSFEADFETLALEAGHDPAQSQDVNIVLQAQGSDGEGGCNIG